MTVIVACHCGKSFRAKNEHAGKQAKCPNCGRVLQIGMPDAGHARARPTAIGAMPGTADAGKPGPPPTSPAIATFGPPSFEIPVAGRASAAPPVTFSDTDTKPSPLDQQALDELKLTEKLRRPIRHAAILCRWIFLWIVVNLAIGLIVGIALQATADHSARASTARGASGLLGAIVFMAVMAGYGVVALIVYLAYKATWESRRWAPLCMFVLNAMGALAVFAFAAIGAAREGAVFVAPLAGFIVSIGPAIVAFVFYRAWDAIPKFLRRPAWCREALLHCGL